MLLGIAGWIVMCIPDCATAAIVPALLGTGLGSAELLRCRRRKKPVRLAAAAPCWSVCRHWLPRCFRVRMRCTVRRNPVPLRRKREAGDSGSARKKSRNRPP